MGTKHLYAKNPIASSPNYYFAVKQVYNLVILLYKIGYSMDRILELKSCTESIKKTMLMHEDIFKQQVKELHRVYNLQRKLMLELKNEKSNIEDPRLSHKSMINNTPQTLPTWQQPRREIGFHNINLYGLTNDQQRERSGSCSGDNSKILTPIGGLNIEMPADQRTSTSNINCASFEHEKSSKMRNIHRCDEETDVELTLSIGPSNGTKRLKSHRHHKEQEMSFSTSAKLGRGEECGDGSPAAMSSTSSATFNKESATQAYWFFQDLSLNRR
ncbi:uncharacterized protein LOC132039682 [Lycium ferocissimum]|uniref:uncharacterized protein LOC132039682 n=1 Tax=Lycium ferocissimum TaxID=112874 RepID=UPI002815CE6D|nr:uncharacterized protein LOC132039682 [Lycium ferocissimum]